jgi:hypothetical protein
MYVESRKSKPRPLLSGSGPRDQTIFQDQEPRKRKLIQVATPYNSQAETKLASKALGHLQLPQTWHLWSNLHLSFDISTIAKDLIPTDGLA